jgi:pyruvate dehydrogenase E2 component (dihydrolipoamide acetyltransferase)
MSMEFKLPSIGEGVETADVAEILVSEGDTIESDQVVAELETEKAVVELPCPHAGTVVRIHVAEGDTIAVGDVFLTIEGNGAPATVEEPAEQAEQPSAEPVAAAVEVGHDTEPDAQTAERPPESESSDSPTETSDRDVAPEATPDEPRKATIVADVRDRDTDGDADELPVPAAPSTRRLARQLGVNLRNVDGSGPGGRITRDDVKGFVKQRLEGPSASAVMSADGGGILPGSLAPPPLPDFTKFGDVEREKLNRIARTAAENLTVSWNVIPHVTQHDRADITELEAARKRFVKGIGQNGPKVTMTAIAIKALATCLQAYPKFNSSLDPETHELVLKKYFHIGCAVDTEHGLVVPVIRDCDQKSILNVASELSELAGLARDRKLPLDAMQGATCTVTNLGGIGGTAFTPIVNYPEVCILGMARSQRELQLVDEEIQERLLLPLALSYDHRVVNGADAARFVATLCNMLADPCQLLSAI